MRAGCGAMLRVRRQGALAERALGLFVRHVGLLARLEERDKMRLVKDMTKVRIHGARDRWDATGVRGVGKAHRDACADGRWRGAVRLVAAQPMGEEGGGGG